MLLEFDAQELAIIAKTGDHFTDKVRECLVAIEVSEDMHDRVGKGMDLFIDDDLKTAAYVKLIDGFRAVAAMMGDAVAARVAALLPESPPDKEAPRRRVTNEPQGYRGTNLAPKVQTAFSIGWCRTSSKRFGFCRHDQS